MIPPLTVITDWSLGQDELLARLRDALAVSPRIAVQHRHPEATGRDFWREAEVLAELAGRNQNPLFINGRLDVALLLDAHLHLGSRAMAARDARAHLGPARRISVAVHGAREAENAAGADFALVSPVFPPRSKRDARAPLGADGFARLAAALPCPAVALGGIAPEHEDLPRLEGAAGFAVIGAVLHAACPAEAAAKLLAVTRPTS